MTIKLRVSKEKTRSKFNKRGLNGHPSTLALIQTCQRISYMHLIWVHSGIKKKYL